MTKRTSGRSTLLSALMLATAILPGSPSGGSVLPGNHLLPLSRRSPGTWVRTLKGVGEGMRGTDTPCSDCCDLLLRANVWPAPSLMEIELRLRGGGESGGDSDDDIGEKGTTMPPPIHVYPTEDSDDAEGVGGEAQNGQGGHEEDDAEEYLEMMRVCAEEVAGGRAELVDAYAILAEARDSGKNITVELFNELLKVCIEAGKTSRATTLDGERVFDHIRIQGLAPTEETFEIMLDLIATGAANKPATGYLSEAWVWINKMAEELPDVTQKSVDLYMKCYDNQWPHVCEVDMMRVGWSFLEDREEKLWAGDPEKGVPCHPSADMSRMIHVDDIKDMPGYESASTRSDSTKSDDSQYANGEELSGEEARKISKEAFGEFTKDEELSGEEGRQAGKEMFGEDFEEEETPSSERPVYDYDYDFEDRGDGELPEEIEVAKAGDELAGGDDGSEPSDDGLPTGPLKEMEYLNTPRGSERAKKSWIQRTVEVIDRINTEG